MKVLVTGGAGFIGSRLVEELLNAGFQVRLLSRSTGQTIDENVEIIQCDLLDTKFDLTSVIDGCLTIINCVGELHNEKVMEPLHVDATVRLVDACKQIARASGNSIHFVQLSSVGAYGPNNQAASTERIVTEDSFPAPVGKYEVTKTKADEVIIAAKEAEVFSYSILRPSNVYGASMSNDSIRQWGRMIQKGMFFHIGSPGAIVTYVHVDDVVDALLLCGFDARAKNEIFNISNDCNQEEFVLAIASVLKVAKPRLRVPEFLIRFITILFSGIKKFPLSHSRIDALVARTHYPTAKLRRVLDFHPKRDVLKTINEVFED